MAQSRISIQFFRIGQSGYSARENEYYVHLSKICIRRETGLGVSHLSSREAATAIVGYRRFAAPQRVAQPTVGCRPRLRAGVASQPITR